MSAIAVLRSGQMTEEVYGRTVVLLSCTRQKAACMFSLNDKWGRSMIAKDEKKVPSPAAELAEIIRGLREKNEWSQAALAASANLSDRTI